MSATKLSSPSADQPAFDAGFGVVVELDGVMIERGGRILFQNVSFSLKQGEIVQLAGANGTGKTSLLRAIAGALPVSAGRLARVQGDVGFLPADDGMWHGPISVRTALSDWAAILGVDAGAVDAVLSRVGLNDIAARALAMLSMGQKRRLSWARLLLRPAPIWLLDEPLNSLDDAGTENVVAVMRAHLAAGGAIVVACHDDVSRLLDAPLSTVRLAGGA